MRPNFVYLDVSTCRRFDGLEEILDADLVYSSKECSTLLSSLNCVAGIGSRLTSTEGVGITVCTTLAVAR